MGEGDKTIAVRRRGSWAAKSGLLCGSVALAAVGAEVGLRLFVPVTDVPFQFWDPLIGLRRIPNQTGRFISGAYINAPYHFNAQGWNHRDDYAVVKPADTRRICVVGDSFVEAMHVPYGQSFFGVAQREMSRPGRSVQWYAFGNSGYGTTHEYLVIHHYVLDYRPDVVVVLFVANDLVDCSPFLARQPPTMATMTLDERDELELIPARPLAPSVVRRLAANFALARFLMIQQRLFTPGATRAGPAPEGRREGTEELVAHGGESLAPFEQRWARSWLLIEKLMARARDECASRGSVFAVAWQGQRMAALAALEGVAYEPPKVEEDPLCQVDRLRMYEMGKQYLEPMMSRLKIPYLDLTEALVEAVRRAGRRHDFPNDAHWCGVGHEAVGRAMARWADRILTERASGKGVTVSGVNEPAFSGVEGLNRAEVN